MFPFAGGLLTGRSVELLVPGQDTPYFIFGTNGGTLGITRVGFRFNTSGLLQRQTPFGFFNIDANMWIHADSQGVVDSTLYECRMTSLAGDVGDFEGPTDWTTIDQTIDMFVEVSGGAFDFEVSTVTGIIQVREIANPTNVRSGNVSITATWEGQL